MRTLRKSSKSKIFPFMGHDAGHFYPPRKKSGTYPIDRQGLIIQDMSQFIDVRCLDPAIGKQESGLSFRNYLPPSALFTSMAVIPARAAFARGLLKMPPELLRTASFPVPGESTQNVAQQPGLLMKLTGEIRKPVQISKTLSLTWGEPGKVKPLCLCLTRQHPAEFLSICLGEVSKGITGCLLIIRGRHLVGHFSVTVQDFLVIIAFRGRTLFEPIQEIFKSLSRLTVSHQHF